MSWLWCSASAPAPAARAEPDIARSHYLDLRTALERSPSVPSRRVIDSRFAYMTTGRSVRRVARGKRLEVAGGHGPERSLELNRPVLG